MDAPPHAVYVDSIGVEGVAVAIGDGDALGLAAPCLRLAGRLFVRANA
jgi:hypothetical protein